MKFKEYIKTNYVNFGFLILGIFFIGMIKGVKAGLFVLLLLILLSSSFYSFLILYNFLNKKKDEYVVLKILSTITAASFIYCKFGLYPLLKIFSLSFIIFFVVIFSIKYFKN